MILQNKKLPIIIIISLIILLIPLIAMLFTEEVNWTIFDFIIAGVLLIGTGIICDLTIRKVKKKRHQIIFIMVVLIVLLLIWAELAVGIFGSPFSGN